MLSIPWRGSLGRNENPLHKISPRQPDRIDTWVSYPVGGEVILNPVEDGSFPWRYSVESLLDSSDLVHANKLIEFLHTPKDEPEEEEGVFHDG